MKTRLKMLQLNLDASFSKSVGVMWKLALVVNMAVAYPAVTIENDRNLITMPDDFNLNRLNGILNHNHNHNHNEGQSEINSGLESNPRVVKSSAFYREEDEREIQNSGEVISSDSFPRRMHRLGARRTASTSTSTSTTTTTTTTATPDENPLPSEITNAFPITLDTIAKLKLSNYLKYFVHPHLEENLEKLKEEPEKVRTVGGEDGEMNTDTDTNTNTDTDTEKETDMDLETRVKTKPTVKTEADEDVENEGGERREMKLRSEPTHATKPRKLGINIPVIRLKVDDRVPLTGKLEVKINADELKPFCWILITFIVLLILGIILGCVFGVTYLKKMNHMQYQDLQSQIEARNKDKCCGSTSGSSIILRERHRERERHSSHPCRCGCEDDVTKTHLTDIIRGDPDRDSGTSSHMGCSSIV